jgi:methionyl-tRNA synthetase
MKPYVSYEEFSKMDLRVGLITECVRKEGSEKLYRLTVDFGEDGMRTILSGLVPYFKPEELLGKQYLFILNLQPRKMMGEESQGMILCAEGKKPYPLKPKAKVKAGAKLS